VGRVRREAVARSATRHGPDFQPPRMGWHSCGGPQNVAHKITAQSRLGRCGTHTCKCHAESVLMTKVKDLKAVVCAVALWRRLRRHSAERAKHNATALNGQPQRHSAERAPHSATAVNGQRGSPQHKSTASVRCCGAVACLHSATALNEQITTPQRWTGTHSAARADHTPQRPKPQSHSA
jgi:hypothetical protein